MDIEKECPPLSEELVEYLEYIYPDQSPSLQDDMDTIRFRSGQSAVVRHLRSKLEEQEEEGTVGGLQVTR